MAEIETIIGAVCETLGEALETDVLQAWPPAAKRRHEAPVVTVSLRAGSAVAAGLAEYLGERYDDETAAWCETYGKRLELTLGVDVYAPAGAGGAVKCLDIVAGVIGAIPALQAGIKVRRFTCGEARFDQATGMFVCPADMECACYFYADKRGDEELSGFILKGKAVQG